MHIGLIGGIGPAATDYYYRRLIKRFAAAGAPLELTMAHADTATLLGNLSRDDRASQAAIFVRLANRLKATGAECVVVTSIAGHFCRDEFQAASPLPAVNLITEVGRFVSSRGFGRIGVIGTRTVMETRFYGGVTTAAVVPPVGQALSDVHAAYVAMAASGVATEAQKLVFRQACRSLIDQEGVEAIMLGGTDLALAFDERESEFTLIDCAAIHVDAIASLAMGV